MSRMRIKNKTTGAVSVEEIVLKNKCANVLIDGVVTGISWDKFLNEYEILGPEEEYMRKK